MSISLDQLSTLVAVCRTGSFTAAADELKLTQPTVSGQMRSLEHELGYALFVRSGRYLIPTDKARVLAVQVAGHLDCVSHAVEGFPALDQHAPRVMHVAGPADYLAVRVMPLLAGLNASGLEFRFTVGDSQRLLMDLATGRHDLVISTTYPHVKGVSSSPLIDLEYVLVASPRWSSQLDAIAGDPTAIGADSLSRIPLVAHSEGMVLTSLYWSTVFSQGTADLHLAAVVPGLREVALAVEHGLGMSVLPRYLVAEQLSRGSLVTLFEPEIPPLNTLHVAIRDGLAHKDPAIRMLEEALLVDAREHDAQFYSPEATATT